MSVSNKTLAVMLLAAIVVSLGGTFVSLSKLGAIGPTGYATEESGTVVLNISTELSITTDNTGVDFGNCTLGDNAAGFTVRSDETYVAEDNCPDYNSFENISVRNNGNINANVTFNASKVGTAHLSGAGTFLRVGDYGVTPSNLSYKLHNVSRNVTAGSSFEGGCMGSIGATVYTAFENTSEILVCSNLTTGTYSMMVTNYEIVVPSAADSGDNVVITFFAQEA